MLIRSLAVVIGLAGPLTAEAQVVVLPDGSAQASAAISQPLVTRGTIVERVNVTLSFGDLAAGETVAADRYAAQGVLIRTGPRSTQPGVVTGSLLGGPCDGSRSIKTEPFTGPSFLLRFPRGVSKVSLRAGDFGPSDQDRIKLTAYGDDALTTVVASKAGTLAEGAPSGCLSLTVAADRIVAVEVTSSGPHPNSIFVDSVTFRTLPWFVVRLEKRGSTTIQRDNNHSENTKIRADVLFPPGHPKAGQRDRTFNGTITFKETPETSYYDGKQGASLLPRTVRAVEGRVEIAVKSVSNSSNLSGPRHARIRARGARLEEHRATNPLAVDQWVDEDSDGFIDWLEASASAIHTCARKRPGEVGTVQKRVNSLRQDTTAARCGSTPRRLASLLPISISPVCGTPNRHRLNTGHELSDTVIHEARHAWQNFQRARRVGIDDDASSKTPSNDDDGDFYIEVVTFTSASSISEAVGGTGDTAVDAGGLAARELDAQAHGRRHRHVCP